MDDKNEISLRTAFYLRVSTEEQAEKYGLDSQKESLDALIKSKGVFNDGRSKLLPPEPQYIYKEDISGTVPLEDRPQFSRLLDDVVNSSTDARPFDVILVYKIDRFARKLKILLEAIDFFDKFGLKFISASESIDTSTSFGRAILGIVGVIAELEIETIKERTHAGRIEAIKAGVYASTPPYGYLKDSNKRLVVYEEEAVVVNKIFYEFVNLKLSNYQIAQNLTKSEITIPRFSPKNKSLRYTSKNDKWFWREQTIRKILKDETYIGNYYYNKSNKKKALKKEDWLLSPYKLPMIVDVGLFYRAQEIISAHPTQINSKDRDSSRYTYLLRSLLKCDCCYEEKGDTFQRAVWHGTRNKTYSGNISYSYICTNKNKSKSSSICLALPLPAKELEEYVIDFIKELIRDPVATFNYQSKLNSTRVEIKYLKSKVTQITKLLNGCDGVVSNLKYQHKHGHLTASEFEKELKDAKMRKVSLEQELVQVTEQLAQHNLSNDYIKSIELFNKAYYEVFLDIANNREEVYQVIHALVEEVIVKTRPVGTGDIIAGKKKEKQQIPYRLEFKLKLPQEFLRFLREQAEKKLNENSQKYASKTGLTFIEKEGRFEVKELTW